VRGLSECFYKDTVGPEQRGQPEGQKSRCARFRDGCQQEITRNAGPRASQDLTPVVNIYAPSIGSGTPDKYKRIFGP
jgi:hypothetical protein